MLNTFFAVFISTLAFFGGVQDKGRSVPTIDDLLNLKNVSGPIISPDGKYIAYTVNETDWKQDAFKSHIWVINVASGKSIQFTRGEKSCVNPKWSPDGQWLAYTSSRIGDKNQILVISPEGGESIQLTKAENGVNDYEWAPNGVSIAYTSSDKNQEEVKARKDYLGDYDVVRKEYSYSHIWTFDLSEALKDTLTGVQRTLGKDFNVNSFSWSPDAKTIAFGATINSAVINLHTGDIYLLDVGNNKVKKIVSTPSFDSGPQWSPDGTQLVFSSAMGNPNFFHANSKLAVVSKEGGQPISITDNFDEIPRLVKWNSDGIHFIALQKTASHLFRIDSSLEKITRLSSPDNLMAEGVSFTKDGKEIAFTAFSSSSLSEIYVSQVNNFLPRKLTSMTDQTKNMILGKREIISWKSKDGVTIEGVLNKSEDFDPSKKYPLLCIIHGGPTGIDRPSMVDDGYPSDIWAARGALILKVNYRGSIGYGEKFRQLNIRNLGVGDAWDVLSGVDNLISKGWVDPKKVGCMGWSQGGYISAFLSTSSDRFAAISVGAGISNWTTHYYNTDSTQFPIQYLGNDPAIDPDIYAKTSPMTYIKQARTPTLILHGELDKRVPIANAYELRQGLVDRGVPTEMVVYKGFGHGINKPKSVRALLQHNLFWFNHYIWNDPMSDFTKPELPKKDKNEEEKKLAGN